MVIDFTGKHESISTLTISIFIIKKQTHGTIKKKIPEKFSYRSYHGSIDSGSL
jgi:hypothetical protein